MESIVVVTSAVLLLVGGTFAVVMGVYAERSERARQVARTRSRD